MKCLLGFSKGWQLELSAINSSRIHNTPNKFNLKSVSELLIQNKNIESFSFSRGKLTASDMSMLTSSLKDHKSLHSLILNHNEIDHKGLKVLLQNLEKTNLQRLELQGNRIGEKGIILLADFIAKNNNLEYFNCAYNKDINLKGLKELCDALEINKKLRHLEVGGCNIGDNGVSQISQMLQHNDALLKIGLSSNCIGDSGASKLAKSVAHNRNLISIDLSNNDITNNGIKYIFHALEVNKIIENINLSSDLIGNFEIDCTRKVLSEVSYQLKTSPLFNSDFLGDCDLDFPSEL